MSEEPKNVVDFVDPLGNKLVQDEKKEVEEKEDRAAFEELLDVDLQSMAFGTKISVYRTKPLWTKGFQGTVEIVKGHPVTMDDLKEEFGGGLYILRFHRSGRFAGAAQVEIGGKPKEDGVIAEHPEIRMKREQAQIIQQNPQQQQAAPQSSLADTILPLLINMISNKDSDNLALIKESMKQNHPPSKYSDMREMLNMVGEINELKGDPNSSNDETELIKDIIGMLGPKKEAEQNTPQMLPGRMPRAPKKVVTINTQEKGAPVEARSIPVPPNNQPTEPVPPIISDEQEEEQQSLAEELAALPLSEINETIEEAFEILSPEKKAQVEQIMLMAQNKAKKDDNEN